MQPFMIKTPFGRFYVKPAGTPDHERFAVDVNGEEIMLEMDDDGYMRAPGATDAGHRLNMGLLNKIADEITGFFAQLGKR
ncbi:hypothetical protein [Chitinophaga sp. sic0106]|uniref:hypothetical protein n=1 Tax=Chitinophaga sp. sic0106 TaxID=2854785 RepID=UPI001C496D22|nr:hypothetical protein [Chitinophaga sp. sic0106]MBV7530558.1 hypothetical protein [Chitinophaga sp. sic0106]